MASASSRRNIADFNLYPVFLPKSETPQATPNAISSSGKTKVCQVNTKTTIGGYLILTANTKEAVIQLATCPPMLKCFLALHRREVVDEQDETQERVKKKKRMTRADDILTALAILENYSVFHPSTFERSIEEAAEWFTDTYQAGFYVASVLWHTDIALQRYDQLSKDERKKDPEYAKIHDDFEKKLEVTVPSKRRCELNELPPGLKPEVHLQHGETHLERYNRIFQFCGAVQKEMSPTKKVIFLRGGSNKNSVVWTPEWRECSAADSQTVDASATKSGTAGEVSEQMNTAADNLASIISAPAKSFRQVPCEYVADFRDPEFTEWVGEQSVAFQEDWPKRKAIKHPGSFNDIRVWRNDLVRELDLVKWRIRMDNIKMCTYRKEGPDDKATRHWVSVWHDRGHLTREEVLKETEQEGVFKLEFYFTFEVDLEPVLVDASR